LLIPGGLIRMGLGWLILREWLTNRMGGALVAGAFFILHGIGSLKEPFYWFWDVSSPGQHMLWFLEILGLSISTIILILNRETGAHQKTADQLRESEQRLTTVIRNLPGMAYRSLADEQFTPVFVSEASEELTEIPATELLAIPDRLRSLIVRQERDVVLATMRTAVAEHTPFELVYQVVTPSGQIRWFLERGRPVEFKDGSQTYVEGFISDITELREAENETLRANSELSKKIKELELRSQEVEHLLQLNRDLQLCDDVEEISQVVSRSGTFLFPGSSGCMFLLQAGESSLRPVGIWNQPDFSELQLDRDSCWAIRRSGGVIERSGNVVSICPRMRSQKGPLEHVCIPMLAQGETLGVLHIQATRKHSLFQLRTPRAVETLATAMAEQTALCLSSQRLRAELAAQAIRDPLTGLYNRRFLFQSIERELAQADRYTRNLGILMIDVDQFKEVNDTFGHDTGDKLLFEVAELLQRAVRAGDIVCRYGGEEFVITLHGATGDECLAKAQEIRLALEAARFLGDSYPVTVSIGTAVYPENGQTPDIILTAADRALYEAKGSGRNCCKAAPVQQQAPKPLVSLNKLL
ncbi:MAG: diguanylate cyclase, partial [Acidobacteriota bacterium]